MAVKEIKVWLAKDPNPAPVLAGNAPVPYRVCVADPVELQPGDTVKWVNKTGDDIVVFFPHDNVLGPTTGHFHNKIPNGASHAHPGAATRKTPPGRKEQYNYSIFCFATNRFAVGGSDPEIIVM